MKITILNGNPSGQANPSFDNYLGRVSADLTDGGLGVQTVTLRDLNLAHCSGCFGCWVKTPGECVTRDDGPVVRQAVIGADFVLYASPLSMGYPSSLLKKAMDKSVPLIMPYFKMVEGEVHHQARYERYPKLGLLIEREATTDEADMQIVTDLFSRTALNMKSGLAFAVDTALDPAEVARKIAGGVHGPLRPVNRSEPRPGVRIAPPRKLTVFNGSPRGPKGNTLIMERKFMEGFNSIGGNESEVYNLFHLKEQADFARAYGEAECVLLGFPLYTDSMPGLVKEFIEKLEPFAGRPNNPPMGFLVQCGFPESLHCRYVDRYLEKLAARLGAPYLGTMVKGGGEAVGAMPENMNRGLFENLRGLGRGLAERGELDAALLKKMAGPERFSGLMAPVMGLLAQMPFVNGYWDWQLKTNGVFEDRFATPYKN
jgi:multimeric flavodoxin WrbA